MISKTSELRLHRVMMSKSPIKFRQLVFCLLLTALQIYSLPTDFSTQIQTARDSGSSIAKQRSFLVTSENIWSSPTKTVFSQNGFSDFSLYLTSGLLGETELNIPLSHQLLRLIAIAIGFLSLIVLTKKLEFGESAQAIAITSFAIFTSSMWDRSAEFSGVVFAPLSTLLILSNSILSLVTLTIVAILWMGSNSGFLGWFFIILTIWLGKIFTKFECDLVFARRIATTLSISLAIIIAFAYGSSSLDHFISIGENNGLVLKAQQWIAPDFHSERLILLGFGVTAICLILMKPSLPNFWRYYFAFSTALILLSLKFQPIFALSCCIVLGYCIQFSGLRETNKTRLSLIYLVGIISIITIVLSRPTPELPQLDAIEQAIAQLKSEDENTPLKILNDYRLGGILFKLNVEPYATERPERLLLPSLIKPTNRIADDYQQIFGIKKDWRKLLDSWEFDAALLRRDTSLANILEESLNWNVLAYSSEHSVRKKGSTIDNTLVLLTPP